MFARSHCFLVLIIITTIITIRGASAGTEIVVPAGRKVLAPPAGWDSCDGSSPGSPGRLTAGWLMLTAHQPILLIETYLWTMEPPGSCRNQRLLDAAIMLIRHTNLPYVWWGDFQCERQELEDLGCWDKVGAWGGAALSPPSATCRSGRAIDLLILDIRLKARAGLPQTLDDWAPRAHRPCYVMLSHERDAQVLSRPLLSSQRCPAKP